LKWNLGYSDPKKKKGFNLVINNPKKNWCLKVLIWCLSKKMVAFVAKICTKLKKRKKVNSGVKC
jgi:hypothetical protein